MMMTEAEAKTKWCPRFQVAVARDVDGTEYASNRDAVSIEGRTDACIGSACMAWRWDRTAIKRSDMSAADQATAPQGGDPDLTFTATRTFGHCGMAGPVFE